MGVPRISHRDDVSVCYGPVCNGGVTIVGESVEFTFDRSVVPTLVLPPRYTPDTIALSRAAASFGWQVERLSSWRVPQWLTGQDIVLYGEPLFAAVVAEPLGISLLEPPFGWLTSLPAEYRQRHVELMTLGEARRQTAPRFIKPADDKCFVARVYESGELLPGPEVLPDGTPVLVAEPVRWEIEFRCFVLHNRVLTQSLYLRAGQLVETAEGEWPASDAETNAAAAFCEQVLRDERVAAPPACVVDVGIIEGRGWSIVEANAAWGSGIYGCDPKQVLEVLRRASVKSPQLMDEDRRWIVMR